MTPREAKSREFDRLTESIRHVARDMYGVSPRASVYPRFVAERERLQAEIERVQEELRNI